MVFTVTADDLGQAKQIVDKVADELNAVAVLIEQDVAKVSIVGAGMLGNLVLLLECSKLYLMLISILM